MPSAATEALVEQVGRTVSRKQ